jgi:hypothetical protein
MRSALLFQGLAAAFNVLGIAGVVFLASRWSLLNDGLGAIAGLVIGIVVTGLIGNAIARHGVGAWAARRQPATASSAPMATP